MQNDNSEKVKEIDLQASNQPTGAGAHLQEALVNSLIEAYRDAKRLTKNGKHSDAHRDLAGADLELYTAWLAEAQTYFRQASDRALFLSLTSEWVLDNYYVIRQALQLITEDLPPTYYAQLPVMQSGKHLGLPRMYGIASEMIAAQEYLFSPLDSQAVLRALQEQVELTIGELWSFPIFVRYCLIEMLARTLVSVIQPETPPRLPENTTIPPPSDGKGASAALSDTQGSKIVANIIISLRAVSEQDWDDFIEASSRLEQILRQDPAGIYAEMDFETRDLYRKKIEALALKTERGEVSLAETLLELARQDAKPHGTGQATHIGEFLFNPRAAELEAHLGYRLTPKEAIGRWLGRHASLVYLGSIAAFTLAVWIGLMFLARVPALYGTLTLGQQMALAAAGIILLVPLTTMAANLVNWLATLLVHPKILPKLEFKGAIPGQYRTLVVIPSLITSRANIADLVHQLELHYLRNSEPGLLFALLSDYRDADSETLPDDEELYAYARDAIGQLNAKYGQTLPDNRLFYLFHRKRLWNPAEGKWMGWERKRGKLHELDLFLKGRQDNSFISIDDEMRTSSVLAGVRYVITLDADTDLPSGAARRLVGTLAHPLNRARFNEKTNEVVSGYSILQPRMEIHPRSAGLSWFTRIFAGDTGLDLYSRAVSDTYQDLFGEGSYVGKGIYDIDAYERSAGNHIPENAILSHDLLEGILGRAGLATDITLVEDYPANYYAETMRLERWIRGDWQLLPWLLDAGKFGATLAAVDRWKITDNLLRSALAPALMLVYSLGMIFVPELADLWLAIIPLTLGIPLITSLTRSTAQTLDGVSFENSLNSVGRALARMLLAIIFLPHEAGVATAAILKTLFRLLFSHRRLLQWTTAAQASRSLSKKARQYTAVLRMGGTTLFVLAVASAAGLIYHYTTGRTTAPLGYLLPLLVLWIASPLAAHWLSLPIKTREMPLTAGQTALLRQVARRTWSFFERFVGPEDHWLPPDHYQETPRGIIAHHTSPSNIGLLLTSILAAYDLGYLAQLELAARLAATLDTLANLERYRGHFVNWYDTLSLKPLQPRYISTVDSGNLAASFIITAQACRKIPDEPIIRWELWQGYLDTLSSLRDIIASIRTAGVAQHINTINKQIDAMSAEISAVRMRPRLWYALFQKVRGQFWQDISKGIVELIEAGHTQFNQDMLHKLHEVTSQAERHHLAVQRTLEQLVPWVPLFDETPSILADAAYQRAFNTLAGSLPRDPRLNRIAYHAAQGLSQVESLRKILSSGSANSSWTAENVQEGMDWLANLETALNSAAAQADALVESYQGITARSEQYVNEMDFAMLYNPQRRVFHIGFNLDNGQLDTNYYDLLASEARIASIVALGKGDVPSTHWLHLGRPLTQVHGKYVLLSWSATMFEYIMPSLFLRSFPNTLLAESAQGAVLAQIAYARSKGVPWGISEAGFSQTDANQNYQYRAFGVPGLGLKRGLGDDLVIAPYASLMAIRYNPEAVAQNLAHLIRHGSYGVYGFYEAIDFTADRLAATETEHLVSEYMAHHQGMVMMALANYLKNDIMVERMHNDARIQSVELFLQEQVPQGAPLLNPEVQAVKGVHRVTEAPVEFEPWRVPLQNTIPQVNLLSNGSYGVLISELGSGYSSWRGVDLTRWYPDGMLPGLGGYVYIQDIKPGGGLPEEGKLWSAGLLPIPGRTEDSQVTFFSHMVVYHRAENQINSTMEITVAPDDPVEIRRLHLHNAGNETRRLRITSYGEVILSQQAADARHPAFSKMFIDSEYVPELTLQIFKRRQRSEQETPIYMGHMLVAQQLGSMAGRQVRHEADRRRFIGRGRNLRSPEELTGYTYLSGTSGATLDPIYALGQEVELESQTNKEIAYLNLAGDSREAVIELATKYRNWALINDTFHQANLSAQAWLWKEDYDTSSFRDTLKVLSALLYPQAVTRSDPKILAANRLGQSGLWRFGISGDYPVILVEIDDAQQLELVREALQAHEFLRSRRFLADVVILNTQPTDYGSELTGLIYRLVNRLNNGQWLNQRGGITILHADKIAPDELTLLETAGRLVLHGNRGALHEQLPEYPIQTHYLPDLIPTESEESVRSPDESGQEATAPLMFANGYGGFSQDGDEYIIRVEPGEPTPAPWINVIGYPDFGFMVSESGSQSTWAINSGENRLSPWFNDPVSDPTGEVLYLRDEETASVWTPTPLPAGAEQPYRVTHGAGYTIFEHNSHGLRHKLTLYASPTDPVKIIHLELENLRNRPRRITATQYVEWVLGLTHTASMQYIIPEYDAGEACLLASNPYNSEFGDRMAFLIASEPVHSVTADRSEFIGRGGSLAHPAALARIGLEAQIMPGDDPCAALQMHLDIPPGGSKTVYFILGQGANRENALALAKKYHNPEAVRTARERTRAFWEKLLGTIQVRTPEASMNVMMNRWLLYQSLSCRMWGRSAFYQPSGAYGFRDQLQDALAVMPIAPEITRRQIMTAAGRQFEQGDVLHWWHPPSGRGVRTRISDDLLWLPYVTALYIEATGDANILNEKVPFLRAPELKANESERYGEYPQETAPFSLLEHCRRAIAKGATRGSHRLPLIGIGDWNDGLNKVGSGGKGESVWLAWFIIDVLKRFGDINAQLKDNNTAQEYRKMASDYAAAAERSAWDGAWYRRAFYDDGTPLGSSQSSECQIDAIAQSWAVISGAGDKERSRQAMHAVLTRLVEPKDRLALLFTPPFSANEHDPGYIKSYPPGTRENGGQYTHAATWTAWAFALLGDGRQAGALFNLLNPILHADTHRKAITYGVEPYVVCADIYSQPPYRGRGGWTWYTGSAAWMYRLGLEAILGFSKRGNNLRIEPVIPPEWDGYEINYR
ncbi:MAG: GH36-type glycosyl hydrolase domain-containing protein, partial [Anaerolineae bacterium]